MNRLPIIRSSYCWLPYNCFVPPRCDAVLCRRGRNRPRTAQTIRRQQQVRQYSSFSLGSSLAGFDKKLQFPEAFRLMYRQQQQQQQHYQRLFIKRFLSSKCPLLSSTNRICDNKNATHQCLRTRALIPSSKTRALSTTASTSKKAKRTRPIAVQAATAAALMAVLGSSYYSRIYRIEKLREIPYAQDYLSEQELQIVTQFVQRMGLMGKRKSVKEELDDIRKWHIENGYKGGLVLRDLTQPVAGEGGDRNVEIENSSHDTEAISSTSIIEDAKILARRECYYLYYEVKPTGAITQQIFCRGTTLFADLLTCFQSWMVYDDDCQCYVHRGFRDHADRILHDVTPLLVLSPRATIEVCGHSLGGAVATILSIKLRKHGHNVIRLTSVGAPRIVFFSPSSKLQQQQRQAFLKLLPKQQIRIENDLDFVTYLPPFGQHVGNRIWLANDGTARFIKSHTTDVENAQPASNDAHVQNIDLGAKAAESLWTESIFYNFQVPEIIASKGWPHRIGCYVQRLKDISPVGNPP